MRQPKIFPLFRPGRVMSLMLEISCLKYVLQEYKKCNQVNIIRRPTVILLNVFHKTAINPLETLNHSGLMQLSPKVQQPAQKTPPAPRVTKPLHQVNQRNGIRRTNPFNRVVHIIGRQNPVIIPIKNRIQPASHHRTGFPPNQIANGATPAAKLEWQDTIQTKFVNQAAETGVAPRPPTPPAGSTPPAPPPASAAGYTNPATPKSPTTHHPKPAAPDTPPYPAAA